MKGLPRTDRGQDRKRGRQIKSKSVRGREREGDGGRERKAVS